MLTREHPSVCAVSGSEKVQQLTPELSPKKILVLAYALAYDNHFSQHLYSVISLLGRSTREKIASEGIAGAWLSEPSR